MKDQKQPSQTMRKFCASGVTRYAFSKGIYSMAIISNAVKIFYEIEGETGYNAAINYLDSPQARNQSL